MSDRPVVVTGGAGGIGGALVARLATTRQVIVFDVAVPADLDAGVTAVEVDLTDRRAVEAAVAGIEAGPVLSVVCCAGVGPAYQTLDALEVETIRRAFEVNVIGIVNVCHAVAPAMRASGWGRIVNISSVTAAGGWSSRGEYAASKAALESVSASLAAELGPHGITVNCVAPGHVRTAMTAGAAIPWQPIVQRTALGRLVTADEVAAAVEFLLSDEASGITGAVLRVDAGYLANQLASTGGADD